MFSLNRILAIGLSALGLTFLMSNCQSTKKSATQSVTSEGEEIPAMRHGWTIFTGPKKTIYGVNDIDSVKRGEKIYKKHCINCHGATGKGDGLLTKHFDIRPANLKNLSDGAKNYYLVMQINSGKGQMPAWKDVLTNSETWDLSNYIQSLSKVIKK